MSSAHCSAINCTNRQSKRPDLSFFKFPRNKDRCQQWVESTRRTDLLSRTTFYISRNCRLCAEHFTEDQFSNRQVKNRLNWNAVPNVFRFPDPPESDSTRRGPRKRKRAAVDSSTHAAAKQQKVTAGMFPVLDEHTYSKPDTDSPRSDSPRAGSPTYSTPSPSSPSPEPVEQLSAEKQSDLLRKERERTRRLKQKLASLKKSMEKAAEESRSIQGIIKNAKQFLQEPALSFFALQLENGTKLGKGFAVCKRCLARMQAVKEKCAS
ncbi:THAP domain-containing protein 3-like [Dunckerocampus dactyliophorus]|uniref:THAP domain-containing protein 3-like n=1 Tax=Dunckerocampus dactyliophorus TaxID=161453 RepID=UPI0024049945|nr:THAP domain-containing protein 3-like [Dunckerocampus dactyliophorus]